MAITDGWEITQTTNVDTLRVIAPHFVAGVVLLKYAAPIIGYMVHWDEDKIREYCAKKGWEVELVP